MSAARRAWPVSVAWSVAVALGFACGGQTVPDMIGAPPADGGSGDVSVSGSAADAESSSSGVTEDGGESSTSGSSSGEGGFERVGWIERFEHDEQLRLVGLVERRGLRPVQSMRTRNAVVFNGRGVPVLHWLVVHRRLRCTVLCGRNGRRWVGLVLRWRAGRLERRQGDAARGLLQLESVHGVGRVQRPAGKRRRTMRICVPVGRRLSIVSDVQCGSVLRRVDVPGR